MLRTFLSTVLAVSWAARVSAAPHEGPKQAGWHKGKDAVRLLYQYPKGTWIENIAVRPSGELLLPILSSPRLDQLDPFYTEPKPDTIHTFSDATGLTGIAETDHDIFVTTAGKFSLTTGVLAGSWSSWKVDFSSDDKAAVTKITELPEVTFPNGMCNLPSSSTPDDILIGDIDAGKIWRLNTTTGEYSIVVDNVLTAAEPNSIFGTVGVNGIHIQNETLYLTNTGLSLFASIPIHPNGTPSGPGHIISHFSNTTQYADDFTIQGDDAYLVTGSGNSIEKVGLDGKPKRRIIAGNLNSTQIVEPTSCAFGRTEWDQNVLYVVTAGGLASPVDGDEVVGAQVLAVDTRGWKRDWGW